MTSVGQTARRKPSVGLKTASKKPKPRKPHNYQRRGVEWLLQHGGAGLFADPGTGKTVITLRALLALRDSKVGRRALVVAPLRVAYKVWPVEAQEWVGSEWSRIQDLKIVVLHGKDKEKLLLQEADIYVINFDGLKWLFADNYKRFYQLEIDTLVLDESSKLKHTRTQRFKMIKPVLPTFKRRWILTGSPNPNGYMDVFGQIYVIDLGHALGRYITHFRLNYFNPLDRNGWAWALKPEAEKQIQKALSPYIFRLDAKDYLQLPKIVPNIVRVDLPESARKIYDEMEEELLSQLADKHVVMAVSSGAAAMKCGQIANGGLYHMVGDGDAWGKRTWTNLHTAKTDAVVELVGELNESPCMITFDFKHDLDRLLKALGENTPHIGGDVSAKQSDKLIDDWNADRIPILLVQPQTVSHGLNLQHGSAQHIIWHSLTYDREQYDQLIQRLARQGSRHKNIFVHHILAVNTIDVAKMRAIKKKGETQQGFLDALKEYAKEKQ